MRRFLEFFAVTIDNPNTRARRTFTPAGASCCSTGSSRATNPAHVVALTFRTSKSTAVSRWPSCQLRGHWAC